MTEKRFTMADGEYNNPICYDYGNGLSYIDVMELLNALHEENQHLRKALTELKEIGDYQADRIKELEGFEDLVFNLLNGKIKRGEQAIEWGERIGADVGAMGFHIELLKRFKKELSE